jgi:hypothetical protein
MKGIGRYIKRKILNKFFFVMFGDCFFNGQILKKFRKRIYSKINYSKYSTNLNQINQFEYRISSQNNEDGIINYITNKISVNKFFVEIGVEFSEFNSMQLIKNGWSGMIIEAKSKECRNLKMCLDYFFPNNQVNILNNFVTKYNINQIIISNAKNKIIDFLSIDIDGLDYYILKNLDLKNVNFICCEYNSFLGKHKKLTVPYNDNFSYKGDYYCGASLNAFNDLLNKKGFFLVAVESAGVNAFFLRNKFKYIFEELFPLLSFREQSRIDKETKDRIYNNLKKFDFIEL